MYLDSLDNQRYKKLTPNYKFDLLIIEQLYTAGVIAVSSVTNLKYISVSEDYIYFNNIFMCWEVIFKETNSLSTIIDLLELKLANIYYLQENKKITD